MNKLNVITIIFNFTQEIYSIYNMPFIYLKDDYQCIWPEFKLISNYSDIENILKLNSNINIISFLYHNKNNIHSILYETENIIELNQNHLKSFFFFFYIDLLIMDNPNIINYSYSMEIIKKVNSYMDNDEDIIKNIILSIISIDLIKNYKNSEKYNFDKDEKELNIIEKINIEIIDKNIKYFKGINSTYNKESFLTKRLEEIYIDIIIELIKNNKFSDYQYTFNIILQLNLESIYITTNMFYKLNNFLEESNIKNNTISKIEDLFDIKKINFYFILLKYILKNSIFIYHIKILLNTRIFILQSIKNNTIQVESYSIKDAILKERLEYIIKVITDSEYYYNEYLKFFKIIQLKEIYKYYTNFLFGSKKKEIKDIKEFIENRKNKKININLKDYEKAKNMNKRIPIIKYLFEIENLNISEYKMNRYNIEWESLQKMIKNKKYRKIRKNITIKLLNYFSENKNKTILLDIFKEEDLQSFINKKIHFIKKDDEIVSNKNNIIEINTKLIQMINSFISNQKKKEDKIDTSIIRESYYVQSNELTKENNSIKQTTKDNIFEDNASNMNISIWKEVENQLYKILLKSSKYKILEFIKIIGNLKRPQFIKKLRKDYFIFGGEDYSLYVYNNLYNFIMKIDIGRISYDIIENIYNNKEIELIVCSQQIVFIVKLDIENQKFKLIKYELEQFSNVTVLQVEENKLIFAGNKGILNIENLLSNENQNCSHKINFNNSYIGGIKINNRIIAFTSNSSLSKGEDKIIFYDWSKNLIIEEIIGYSFIISVNGLCLIKSVNNNLDNKILLCACKKYNQEGKNGILLIYINYIGLRKILDISYKYFYDTGNFEVFCFCQISNVNNENPINGNIFEKENIKIINTNYFLVGGFHIDRRQGMIKLYKVTYNNNFQNLKIVNLQDIKFENNNEFKGFDGPISSITQSEMFGNIIVSCWDENIYLFKPPNIDYYLQFDK